MRYTDLDVDTIDTKRKSVCRYCGRPLKTPQSLNQGCGSVCIARHKKLKYRTIGGDLVVDPKRRFKKFE